MKITIKDILIAVLVVFLLFKSCDNGKKLEPKEVVKTTIETKTVYDTIINTVVSYKPKYISVIKTKVDSFYIDTNSVVSDYFDKYVYSDTIKKDSINLVINDTISRNKIESRSIDYQLIYPHTTTTITNEVVINKNKLFFGGEVGVSKTSLEMIQLGFLLKTKKDIIYGAGIGATNDLSPFVSAKIYYKLKLTK